MGVFSHVMVHRRVSSTNLVRKTQVKKVEKLITTKQKRERERIIKELAY